jgi:Icc-related predicted phosphoesterase
MTYAIGDIHGNLKRIREVVENRDLRGDTIIQVGDFGMGYHPKNDKRNLQKLNEYLAGRDCTLWVIRGNHDDPAFFDGKHHLSHVNLVKDYTVAEIEGLKYLFCGGATSIDRMLSIDRMFTAETYGYTEPCYWPGEKFVLRPDLIEGIGQLDVVVTHTAPEWCHPDNKNGFGHFVTEFFKDDPNLERDLRRERADMTELFGMIADRGARLHLYGHYHQSRVTVGDHMTHVLLNIGEDRCVQDLLK